jgi:hypothetical protein
MYISLLYLKALCMNFSGGTEGKHGKPKDSRYSAWNRAGHLSNTSSKRNRSSHLATLGPEIDSMNLEGMKENIT